MKKIISLILTVAVFFSVITSVSAEYASDYTEKPVVSVFGEGISNDASLLTDGFYYNYYEWRYYAQHYPGGADYAAARPDKNPDKFVKFTSTDSGIEFSWSSPQNVKRLELWVWNVGAVGEYEIQSSDDGETWVSVCTGNLDQSEALPATSNNAYFYPILFDEISTQKLRFVIKSFGNNRGEAFIAEAVPRSVNDINYLSFGLLGSSTSAQKFSSPYIINYKASNTSGGAAYMTGSNGEIWPCSGSALNVIPDATGKCWYVANFSLSQQKINRAALNVKSGTVKGCEILCTNDIEAWKTPMANDDAWTTAAKLSGSLTGRTVIDIPDAASAKYWMIKITSYEGTLSLAPAELYTLADEELEPVSHALKKIFDGVTDEVVITGSVNLPGNVTVDGHSFDVVWHCDAQYVDVSTGAVTRPTDDVTVTLTAEASSSELMGNTRILEKNFVIGGTDSRKRALLKNETFEKNATEIFSEITGDVTTAANQAVIKDKAAADYDIAIPRGFKLEGKTEAELSLGTGTTGGKISFMDGDVSLLELTVADNKITTNYKGFEKPFASKLKIEISGDMFTMYLDDGSGYKICLYKGALAESGCVADRIGFSTEDGQKMEIKGITVSVISEELFNAVSEQFGFSKICDCGSADVNCNLKLIDKIGDILLSYESSDEEKLNPLTGEVDLSVPGEPVLTVTGTSESGSFTKVFKMVTGRENLFEGAAVSATATATSESSAAFAGDTSLETAYITDAGYAWKLTLDLKEKRYFNQISIFEADTASNITDYVISVSTDGRTFSDVYSGTQIENGKPIDVGINNARYIRLTAAGVSGAGTGIAEICGYFNLTDEERTEAEISSLTKKLTVQDGTEIPKTGELGTVFKLISSNDAVKIEDEGDKWKVVFGKPTNETYVTVKLVASNGAAVKEKDYNVIILGSSDIRGNKIVNGNTGKKSTGSGTAVPYVPEKDRTSAEIQNPFYEELYGHWGEKEISALVDRKIVEGDSKTLGLKRAVTRAEFLKMILKAFKYEITPYQEAFEDVEKGAWYADYTQTALQYKIMTGDGIKFHGNSPITRQEMAVVLMNVLKQKGVNTTADAEKEFTDLTNIADWAAENVKNAVGLGLIKGYENGTFLPQKELQRDESMVVIYRALELEESSKTGGVK